MNRLVEASILVFIFLGVAYAQDQKKLREVNIVGEVVDSKCYLTQGSNGRGEQHRECALQCARNGIPLAILEEETESVYFVAKIRGMGGANEILMPFVAERVSVRGKLAERGAARLLLIETIERAPATP